jgi:PadR family transcriptional regulator PadR
MLVSGRRLCRHATQLCRSVSTQPMARDKARIELLQGTLDLLILRTLRFGPSHGHAVAKQIRLMSDDVLQVETGSLYPSLHRLEAQGWISSEWQLSDKGKRAKYYRLTATGRKQLVTERTKWEQLSMAMARVLKPVNGE